MTTDYPDTPMNRFMKAANINGPQLAKLVGCSGVEIWRLRAWPEKKDGRKMNVSWAEKIAPHIGCKPEDLIFERKNEQSMPWSVKPIGKPLTDVEAELNNYFQITCQMESRIDQLEAENNRLNKIIDKLVCA